MKDIWFAMPGSDYSAGSVVIEKRFRREWETIWWKCYGGMYPKEVSALIRPVVHTSYAERLRHPFQGCRGPEEKWIDDTYVYQNILSAGHPNTFRRFAGHERVLHYPNGFRMGEGIEVGYHSYFGGQFVPTSG